MDIPAAVRETDWMLAPGRSRERLAGTLSAAFAEGLLSEQTLSYRLELLFGPRLIEPGSLVGDLALRDRPTPRPAIASALSALAAARAAVGGFTGAGRREPTELVLALDWAGAHGDLLIGRSPDCDVRLGEGTVSRRHARLVFRDGAWMIQDLASRNGVTVNGTPVGRCQLRPGDRLGLGLQLVEID
ncbi:MAG TPA: FHA domain-containing protein [Solirubrobacteraceae bacterium]|jgi:hypothetical protein|nr:FHA domain-containing protein [Solirubrobacteraceae bacterium]